MYFDGGIKIGAAIGIIFHHLGFLGLELYREYTFCIQYICVQYVF